MANENLKPDELAHYGVRGQRWGIRRYQDSSGKYTDAGKKRASSDSKKQENAAKIAERKKTMKNRRTLSDKELSDAVGRLQLEKKLKDLTTEDISAGRSEASRMLKQIGTTAITTAATGVATYAVKAALEGKFDPKAAASFIRPKK